MINNIKRLRKFATGHDVDNRDRAISIINGEVIEAESHAAGLDFYLNDHGEDPITNGLRRPAPSKIKSLDSINSFVAAHLVKKDGKHPRIGQAKDEIFIESNTMIGNITFGQVVQIIRSNYPDADIYEELEGFGQVFKVKAELRNIVQKIEASINKRPTI